MMEKKCSEFNQYNFKTYIDLPEEKIEFDYRQRCNYQCDMWSYHLFEYTDDDIMQVIERNKINNKLELSYWVKCPSCGEEHLLKRIT